MSGIPEWALERLYDAPSELVWQGWTDPAIFSRWYGPNVETVIHKMDVQVGGECLLEMKWGENSFYQKFEYLEVKPYERLVWAFASTDENWEIIRSPHIEDWPVILISTMTIDLELGQPLMRFTWAPYNASDAEIACFKKSRLDIDAGWNAVFKPLNYIMRIFSSFNPVI
jgi:uncharacterized protein YndB with AHSA1/START domain